MAQLLIMVRAVEVEPHVAHLRAQFDPSARRGLGAHVTILHANMPSDRMDPLALERIAAAVAPMARFDYQITRLARFPGTLYLVVEPAAPFALLQGRLAAAMLMEEREGRGEDQFIPHISIVRKSATEDSEVEAELATMLERHAPISCVCREVVLLENSSGRWRPVQEFVLNGDTGNPWRAPS